MSTKSVTTEQAAIELTRGVQKWGTWTLGTPATVSYGFLDYGLQFTPRQAEAAQDALALWSDVANIKFVAPGAPGELPYVSGGIVSMPFVNYYDPDEPSVGHFSGVPNDGFGIVGMNLAKTNGSALAPGQDDFDTLIHEVGHAIGLLHPGGYNATDDPPPTYKDNAGYLQDTKQYSIMSYFSETERGADFQGISPSTPLLHDIAAAQRLYGVNTTTRTGDTTYGFNSNADRESFRIDGANEKVVFAIWDAGGNDTLDLSGYTENQQIDLNPGKFTNAGGLRGNIAIAEGAYIENARGGSGHDTIVGNGLSNTLSGGLGNDMIDGRAGGDRMIGGLGNDVYYVDNWADVVIDQQLARTSLSGLSGQYKVMNAGVDKVMTTLNTYTLPTLIENVQFIGTGRFTGYGNALDNSFVGGSGNDTFHGLDGNDTFYGMMGADHMKGGAGDDTYIVNDVGDVVSEFIVQSSGPQSLTLLLDAGGTDTVKTTLGKYTLGLHVENLSYVGTGTFEGVGNTLDNRLNGGGLADSLMGRDGADILNGGAGADYMNGGAGDDTYFVDNAGDVVSERAGSFLSRPVDAGGVDKVFTSLNTYTLTPYVENLTFAGSGSFVGIGNAIANHIVGGIHADTLAGGAGNDKLDGVSGADTLLGENGDDVLKLGSSPDDWLAAARVDGGADTDTLDLSEVAASVSIDLAAGTWARWNSLSQTASGVVGGRFSNIENVIGSGHGDQLSGDAGRNVLSGLAGQDTLEGRGGNDVINAGAGNDTIVMRGAVGDLGLDSIDGGDDFDTLDFADLQGSLSVNLATGTLGMIGDMSGASLAGIRGIEAVEATQLDDLILGDATDNLLRGNGGSDRLEGRDGDDQLDGGTGADTMVGGTGDDQYGVDDVADQVIEDIDGGSDTVFTSLAQYALGANLENLTSSNQFNSAYDFHGIGNELDNRIFSGDGNDVLDGGAGNDRLASDEAFFGANPSTRDTLIGGQGDDTLSGGGSADLFVYRDGDIGHDTITDFNEAEGDKIDLSSLTGATSFGSLMAVNDANGDVVLSFDDISITLENVVATSLDGSEFVFAPAPVVPDAVAQSDLVVAEAEELPTAAALPPVVPPADPSASEKVSQEISTLASRAANLGVLDGTIDLSRLQELSSLATDAISIAQRAADMLGLDMPNGSSFDIGQIDDYASIAVDVLSAVNSGADPLEAFRAHFL